MQFPCGYILLATSSEVTKVIYNYPLGCRLKLGVNKKSISDLNVTNKQL